MFLEYRPRPEGLACFWGAQTGLSSPSDPAVPAGGLSEEPGVGRERLSGKGWALEPGGNSRASAGLDRGYTSGVRWGLACPA